MQMQHISILDAAKMCVKVVAQHRSPLPSLQGFSTCATLRLEELVPVDLLGLGQRCDALQAISLLDRPWAAEVDRQKAETQAKRRRQSSRLSDGMPLIRAAQKLHPDLESACDG